MITVARLALATSDTQEQPHPAPDARLFHARDGEGRSGPRRGRARQDHRARPAAARAAGPGVERHEHPPVDALSRTRLDRGRNRAEPPLRPAAGVHRAGAGRDSARHLHAQGGKIGGLRQRNFPGVLRLLSVLGFAGGGGQAEDSAGPGGDLAAGCGLRPGRHPVPLPHGEARRPRPADRRAESVRADLRPPEEPDETHAGSGAFFRLAPAAAAADRRHLHPLQLPLLHARGAGELRLDGGGLQFLRADGRHAAQQLAPDHVHVPVLPDPAADLQAAAHQRAGGGAGDPRGAEQAERGDGVQGVRRQPVPAGDPDPGREHALQRRAVRIRFLLRAQRQPQAGRAARRDQGPAQADLSQSRTASGSWARIPGSTITSISTPPRR